MDACFEGDRGHTARLGDASIARAPLTRLGSSLYMLLIARSAVSDPVPDLSDPPSFGPHWHKIEQDIDGGWSFLDLEEPGGGGASMGPHGTEILGYEVFQLPAAGVTRLRLRYRLGDSEEIEEVITMGRRLISDPAARPAGE